MRVVFMGTPQFAVPCLESMLTNPNAEIVGVYTQPDRVNRRGKKMSFSPVKECALAHDLPLYQPATLRDADAQKELQELAPELLIVVAYGQIGSLINYLGAYLHSVQKPYKRSWLMRIQRLAMLHSKHTIGPHIPGKLLKNGDESTGVKMRAPFII